MFRRVYIIAAFVGLLIGGAVWFWPAGPMWESEPGVGRICGFSLDRRFLVTCSDSARGEQQVSRWDADTGRLLSRAVMACDEPKERTDLRAIRPSPDGSVVLVAQGVPPADSPGMVEIGTGDWFIHDAVTGQRLLGPIKGANNVDFVELFSLDGRWFAAYRGEPRSGVRRWNALGIYASATGECVVEFTAELQGNILCRFAPDCKSAAVCWAPYAKNADKHSLAVRLFELPSGRLLRRAEIHSQSRSLVHRWDGRYLTTIEYDLPEKFRQRIVYDFAEDPLGAGTPDLVVRDYLNTSGNEVHFHWQDGSDWLAFFIDIAADGRRSGVTGWLDWLMERIGRKRDRRPVAVRIVDRATGNTRYELPRLVPSSLVFSPDGKRVACGGGGPEGKIEVWNLDPPPRWPYAVAWGTAAAGVLLAIGNWRRHRAPTNAARTASA